MGWNNVGQGGGKGGRSSLRARNNRPRTVASTRWHGMKEDWPGELSRSRGKGVEGGRGDEGRLWEKWSSGKKRRS
jgi:hypothetical protein